MGYNITNKLTLKKMKKYFIYIPVILVVIAIPVAIVLYNKEKIKDAENIIQESNDPQGTIYVEAGEGTLTGAGSFSYIQESARGLEAYLAEKGASATYIVNSDDSGDYTLWVKLSDDGIHPSNTRDATVVINNSRTLVYQHVSEDTKGWKWYEVGYTGLNEGENTIVFTKNESSSGAYVMDEFKLVPLGLD